MDLYLKFKDEQEAQDVLNTKVVTEWTEPENPDDPPEPVEWCFKPNYANIDMIGIIQKTTGQTTTDEEGNEIPVIEELEGWHVNIRVIAGEDPAPLKLFEVYPSTPIRVWA